MHIKAVSCGDHSLRRTSMKRFIKSPEGSFCPIESRSFHSQCPGHAFFITGHVEYPFTGLLRFTILDRISSLHDSKEKHENSNDCTDDGGNDTQKCSPDH